MQEHFLLAYHYLDIECLLPNQCNLQNTSCALEATTTIVSAVKSPAFLLDSMAGKDKPTTLEDLALVIRSIDKKFDDTLQELRADRKSNKNQFKNINSRLNQVESYVYKKSLIISGIKPETDEDLCYIVVKIAQNLGNSISATEIDDIWRIGRDNEKIKVVFLRTLVKRGILKKARELKSLSTTQLGLNYDQNVYLSEEVGIGSSKIWYRARHLKKDGKIAKTWLASGKVWYKVNEADKPKQCEDIEELLAVAGKEPMVVSSETEHEEEQQQKAPSKKRKKNNKH